MNDKLEDFHLIDVMLSREIMCYINLLLEFLNCVLYRTLISFLSQFYSFCHLSFFSPSQELERIFLLSKKSSTAINEKEKKWEKVELIALFTCAEIMPGANKILLPSKWNISFGLQPILNKVSLFFFFLHILYEKINYLFFP